jgi:hypothetical protein
MMDQSDTRSDSSLGPSASAVKSSTSTPTALQTSLDGLAKLVAERFDQSAVQAKTMSERLNRVESRHGELAGLISRFTSSPPAGHGVGGPRTCFKCGSADHLVQDCPKGKKAIVTEAAEAEEK